MERKGRTPSRRTVVSDLQMYWPALVGWLALLVAVLDAAIVGPTLQAVTVDPAGDGTFAVTVSRIADPVTLLESLLWTAAPYLNLLLALVLLRPVFVRRTRRLRAMVLNASPAIGCLLHIVGAPGLV